MHRQEYRLRTDLTDPILENTGKATFDVMKIKYKDLFLATVCYSPLWCSASIIAPEFQDEQLAVFVKEASKRFEAVRDKINSLLPVKKGIVYAEDWNRFYYKRARVQNPEHVPENWLRWYNQHEKKVRDALLRERLAILTPADNAAVRADASS
ncbi:hypothetical protein BCV70DRAFT_223939 [Testicularia cyperi]|uniref:Uncharacterized protein n=1 Tax=Testicularia cyperi TaxID=1882483 RepID=A0A317XNR8_9BASI|nr:hypothetical protein BCV70DRAFT_223939 [Testicularia cyperi]